MKKILYLMFSILTVFCCCVSSMNYVHASEEEGLYDITPTFTFNLINDNGVNYYDGLDQYYVKIGSTNLSATAHRHSNNIAFMTMYEKIGRYTISYDEFDFSAYPNLQTVIIRHLDASSLSTLLSTLDHKVDVVLTGRCNIGDISTLKIRNLIIANGFTYDEMEEDYNNLVTSISTSTVEGIQVLDYMSNYVDSFSTNTFVNSLGVEIPVTVTNNLQLLVTERSINYCNSVTNKNYIQIGMVKTHHFSPAPTTFSISNSLINVESVDERLTSIKMTLGFSNAPVIEHKLDQIFICGTGNTDMSGITADTLIIDSIKEDSIITLPKECKNFIVDYQTSIVNNVSILLADGTPVDSSVNMYISSSRLNYIPQYSDVFNTTLPNYHKLDGLTIDGEKYLLSSGKDFTIETFMYSLEQYLNYGYKVTDSTTTIDNQFIEYNIRRFDDEEIYSIKNYGYIELNSKDDINKVIIGLKPYLLQKDGNSCDEDYSLIIGDIYNLEEISYLPCVVTYPNGDKEKIEFIIEYNDEISHFAKININDRDLYIFDRAKSDTFNDIMKTQLGENFYLYKEDLNIGTTNYIDKLDYNSDDQISNIRLLVVDDTFVEVTEPDEPGEVTNPENPGETAKPENPSEVVDPDDLEKEPEPVNPSDENGKENVFKEFIDKLKDNNVLKISGLVLGTLLGFHLIIFIFKGFKHLFRIFKK